MRLAPILASLIYVIALEVHAADDWTFLVSPYIWFAGAEGDLTSIQDAPATAIDVSAMDALSGTEASFMLMLEAQKQGHGVLLDIFYSDVLQQQQPLSAAHPKLDASLEETLITVGYTYEVYRGTHTVIDLIGGARYWEVGTKLQFTGSAEVSQSTTVHNSESWLDPLAGIKAKARLGDSRLYLACFLGGGGSSGGDDNFYDVTANVGYAVTNSVVAAIGYRLFNVDYEHNAFVYDVKQQGWMLGLVWVFGTNRLSATH